VLEHIAPGATNTAKQLPRSWYNLTLQIKSI
jgi:hypothetical protein